MTGTGCPKGASPAQRLQLPQRGAGSRELPVARRSDHSSLHTSHCTSSVWFPLNNAVRGVLVRPLCGEEPELQEAS